jgi:two-component system sensor histidine kinase RegB
VLVLDTLLLTALLYFTGGPNNPFSVFYLIHIALAASLLGVGWTWGLLALSLGCFGMIYHMNVPLPCPTRDDDPICGLLPMRWHLAGMYVALALTGACLAWFVARLNTRLREQTAARHVAELRAEREARFDSLVTLAAGVAHEISSPLATITVAAKELEHEACQAGSPEGLLADARLIRAQVERCRAILGRLHDRTGGTDGLPETGSAAGLVEALRRSLENGRSGRLRCRIQPGAEQVRAPLALLLQSLSHLVGNAFDASPVGATVSLDITRTSAGLIFAITDQGTGLAPGVAEHLGEPFVTTKEPGLGTGLGLFLVRRFAEQMGGTFTLGPATGQEHGTCAVLTIPQEQTS